MVERTLSVYRGGKLHCCLLIFRLLPLQSQPTGEPFSFACKAVSPMGSLANVPNSSCLEHLRFSYVYGFALFPFSWLSSILGFTEFSWKPEKLHYDAIEQQGRLVRSSCGSLPPHPTPDGIHARRTFLSG